MNLTDPSGIDQACTVAIEFCKTYYGTIDRRRHLISRLYWDTALLTWNGNGFHGNKAIQDFLSNLPPSEHRYISIDSQPIITSSLCGQITYLVQTSGTVTNYGRARKHFQQSFVLSAIGDKWKIVTDCFRLQEATSEERATNIDCSMDSS